MHGIILAGGTGSRLGPVTRSINKHLLPIYDKPMVFYPLTSLILAGVKEITIITTSASIQSFQNLLLTGSQWGIKIHYRVQDTPSGISDGLRIAIQGRDPKESNLVILGDNIFHGLGLGRHISELTKSDSCQIWSQYVQDPESFGIAQVSESGQIVKIVEKPREYVGNNAITGLYFFPSNLNLMLANLEKSERGEFEIADVLSRYLSTEKLILNRLNRGVYWLDAGTIENLVEVSQYVRAVQLRQGLLIGSPDEACFRVGNISHSDFIELINRLPQSAYRSILEKVLREDQPSN